MYLNFFLKSVALGLTNHPISLVVFPVMMSMYCKRKVHSCAFDRKKFRIDSFDHNLVIFAILIKFVCCIIAPIRKIL